MGEKGRIDEDKRATLRRFAALGAASSFAGFASANSDSTAPDAIAGYLTTTPGAHFSKIRDDLKLGTGETQHHLRRLESQGAIETRKDGEYRRFFPADHFSEFEQVALGYLRRETPRGMIIRLLQRPEATGSDLAEALDVSRPTVSKYAAELDAAGIMSRTEGYALENPETLLMLLVRYADSFGPDAVALARTADRLINVDR